jgi:hypothetical protein
MGNYKKGKLTPDKIERLEKIGFTWKNQEKPLEEKFDEWFEKGFKETLFYKMRTGNPNAPEYNKTVESYGLGAWQNRQKQKYLKGKLSPDKIERLEKIGFKWEIQLTIRKSDEDMAFLIC